MCVGTKSVRDRHSDAENKLTKTRLALAKIDFLYYNS